MDRKKTISEVREYVESFNYTLISTEYINAHSKLKIMCSHGHEFSMKWNNFQQGKRCPECYNNSKRISFDEVKKYINSYGYVLLSEKYEDSKQKMKVCCPSNHIFETSFNRFKQGKRCPECYKNLISIEYISKYAESFNYNVISTEYINAHSKIEFECNNGHKFKMSWSSFQQGIRCPECKKSKGENKVAEVLEKFNIRYETQKRFDDCRHKRPLPFDLYMIDYNILIEYDGEHHHKLINWSNNLSQEQMEKNLKNIQLKDEIKDKYCKENKIHLIRIPYIEFDNIENIIKEVLFCC